MDLLVQNGYNVLWLDTDTIAYHDPFVQWVRDEDEREGYDLMAMSDFSGSPSNRPWLEVARKCPVRPCGP
jgi:hypothetical protein